MEKKKNIINLGLLIKPPTPTQTLFFSIERTHALETVLKQFDASFKIIEPTQSVRIELI